METRNLGELIRHYRILRHMTQEELGARCGYKYGKTAISKIERGINDANSKTIIKIARALDVSPVLFLEQFNPDNYAVYFEYLPYLASASEETLRNIRFMLHMPEKNSVTESTKEIG